MGADLEAHVVDDVDVSVARELDAEVLDLEDGLRIGVRLEAVGARCPRSAFSGGKALRRASSAWASYASDGVGDELVGLAVRCCTVGVARP